MFNQLHAVTDLIGDHLVRGVGRIAPVSHPGTAEGLVNNLSQGEKEIFKLIGSGSVRRNQLDEVRTALQAARMLKKYRYGGDPEAREKSAFEGFRQRNAEGFRPRDHEFLRKQLLARMAKILKRVLPPPVDYRHVVGHVVPRAGYDSIPCDVYYDLDSLAWTRRYTYGESHWEAAFGTGAVCEKTPFIRRWEMVDGSSPILEATRLGDISSIMRGTPVEGTSRACCVPKDMAKDRLITVEPMESTFLQHAVRRMLYESIHAGPLAWSAMDVRHLDNAQLIQQRYALTGSESSSTATIDLSDASDRIRFDDVIAVFPAWCTELLSCCRSTHCEIGGVREELSMYAGMGNASTFVIETLMFWAAAQAIVSLNGHEMSVCSVYGDDVVCDNAQVPYLFEGYEALGWVVNRDKSFWGPNPFRESCGMWAFNGACITPIRFDGYDLGTPEGRTGFRESIAGLLNSRCGLNIVVADRLMKSAGPFVPVSSLDIPGSTVVFDKYGMWCNNHSRINTRINRDLQQLEVKVEMTSPLVAEVPADRVGYLYGCLAGQIRTSTNRTASGLVRSHVVRIPVPRRYQTRKRWVPAYAPSGLRESLKAYKSGSK